MDSKKKIKERLNPKRTGENVSQIKEKHINKRWRLKAIK